MPTLRPPLPPTFLRRRPTRATTGRRRGFGRSAAPALVAGLVLVAPLAVGAGPARAHGDGSYPRTFNINARTVINAAHDSRYDVAVLSPQVLNSQLDSLRLLNPSIRRLAYLAFYHQYYAGPSGYPAAFGPYAADDPVYGFDRKYWDLLEDNDWWMYSVDSSGVRYHASIAFRCWMGNFSTKCPPNARGQRLCDVFADFLADELVGRRHVEGLYFDYCNDLMSWVNWNQWAACANNDCRPGSEITPDTNPRSALDADNDGVPDPPDSLDAWWNAGMRILMSRLRARLGPDYILVGNGQHHYTDMNGAMVEKFPFILGDRDASPNPYGYKWSANMFSPRFGYLGAYETIFPEPRVNMIDIMTPPLTDYEPVRTPERERFKRFALGSTLLGDGYFGVRGNDGSACVFWEPEYELRLGWPTGPATAVQLASATLWKRSFDTGEVWVNPTGYAVEQALDRPAVPAYDAVIVQTKPMETAAQGGAQLRLAAPWPNPGSGSAALEFTIPAGAPATLVVFDVRGRLVREVWSGVGNGALQTAVWDGASGAGRGVSAGIYLAALSCMGEKREQRIVRLP